jgi:hypothetical protein
MLAAAGYFPHAITRKPDGMDIDIEPGWGLA